MDARPVGELEALARPYSNVSVPDDVGVPGVFADWLLRNWGSEISAQIYWATAAETTAT